MRVLAGHEIIKLQNSLQSQGEETGVLLYPIYCPYYFLWKFFFVRNKDVLTTAEM